MQSLSSVRSNAGQRLQAQAPVRRTFVRGGLVVEARARRAGVGLLGTKAGMTSINSEDGKQLFACTVIGFESPNFVTQKLTKELNGYDALQVLDLPNAPPGKAGPRWQHMQHCTPPPSQGRLSA